MSASMIEITEAISQPAETRRRGMSLLDVVVMQRLADHVRDQGIQLSATGGPLEQVTTALLEAAFGILPSAPSQAV